MTRSRLSLAALATLTLVGGWMRVRQARESLWLDELHTAWCALGSLAEVAPRATIGNQSPLFFWLQWLLVQLLGASELTLRLPSIVAGTLLPAALFFVTRRGTESAWCGLVAAALVVVDPLSIFFATEARPYALIQLLAVLHVGLFAEVLQRPTPRLRLALVAGAALLFHLHYTAILLVAGELVALVLLRLWASKPPEYRGRAAALDLVLIALLCLPAVGNL
ncbi:MAG: glycosyltransferase family 39 protein, partial [Pirellulaceae bacterium]